MQQINEELIRDTFNEMLKHRPALQKNIMIFDDDDDDDDEVDYRVLGDLIIKSFPWPLGVELRRLFSGSMRQLDRMRLDQIFKTIERSMQFLSFIMLAQLWRDSKQGNFIPSEQFSKEFNNRFQVLSLGNFSWFIRAASKEADEQEINWFMPEMHETLNKKFFTALDFWVPERNEIGHYQINLTDEDIEKRCVEYELKLTDILKSLAFLAKYKLVSVREIKVKKPKNKSAEFHHTVDLLNSSDSDFKAKELVNDVHTESSSILLMKSVKSIDEYLNLSPLIIDTHGEILDSKDKFSIKKDVFLYTKYRNDQIFYLGTEVTEKCDLRNLSNYSDLLDEFKDLFKSIGNITL